MTSTTTDQRAKVYDILKSFKTAMLVTSGPSKVLESRPMQMARVDDDGEVWFFTGKGGRVVSEIGQDATVLLVMQDEHSAYLSLRGVARVVQDRAKVQELWKEPYKVWFPGGAADPDLTLVSVTPVGAEYWDTRGTNKMEYLFEAAKAYIKGEKPRVDEPGQHGKTNL